jgi:curved DNA-binding protein
MLGGEIEVPTLAGQRLLRIPAETADGRRIRLKGQGMPVWRRTGQAEAPARGDLYVEVHVQLPRGLSPRQRELFEELARLERGQSSAAD